VVYNQSSAPIIMAPSLAPSLLAPRSLPRKHHVCVDANVLKDLDAKCAGAKMCNLGANNDGAKLRVHFLNFTNRGIFVRIFRKRTKKQKKKTVRCASVFGSKRKDETSYQKCHCGLRKLKILMGFDDPIILHNASFCVIHVRK
jgi:phage/plasmid primase-like uncharacterized protein